jgi:hypothetical protein
LTFICANILFFGLRRENARRDARYGPVHDTEDAAGILRSSSPGSAELGGIEEGKHHVGGVTTVVREKARATTWQEDLEDREYLERWGLQGMSKEEIIDLGDDHPAFRFMY